MAEAPHEHPHRENPLGPVVTAIREGNCVAFVGAGFAIPSVPGWGDLLRKIADELGVKEPDPLRAALKNADSFRLEAVAQALADLASRGSVPFPVAVQKSVGNGEKEPLPSRVHWLSQIPFKAIVTTNFDPSLAGMKPSAIELVAAIQSRSSVWTRMEGKHGSPRPARGRVLKLHGDTGSPAGNVVLGRRDYRRLVHGQPGYTALLAALLSTSDVLFLGTSFSDAYLNELRQQVLQWFEDTTERTQGKSGGGNDCLACRMPVKWWALMPDTPPDLCASLAMHEGLRVIPYDTHPGAVEHARDHREFDTQLKKLAKEASLAGSLQARYSRGRDQSIGKGIIWHDPKTENNTLGNELFSGVTDPDPVVQTRTFQEFEAALQHSRPRFVICNFGGRDGDKPACAEIIALTQRSENRAPVIVFAGREQAESKRWTARSLGAIDYCHSWQDLFRVVAELLETEGEREFRLGMHAPSQPASKRR